MNALAPDNYVSVAFMLIAQAHAQAIAPNQPWKTISRMRTSCCLITHETHVRHTANKLGNSRAGKQQHLKSDESPSGLPVLDSSLCANEDNDSEEGFSP